METVILGLLILLTVIVCVPQNEGVNLFLEKELEEEEEQNGHRRAYRVL